MSEPDLIKAQLVDFYDANADARAVSELRPDRTVARDMFAELLAAEQRTQLVDLGCGAGQDAAAFVSAGFDVVGFDLSLSHCRHTRDAGAAAAVGDFYHLPFRTGTAAGAWCVSAYVHVPAADLTAVLAETRRVLAPGAPLLAGVWTGEVSESVRAEERGNRFYLIMPPQQWLERLQAVFAVERWWTDTATGADHDYLWCLARA